MTRKEERKEASERFDTSIINNPRICFEKGAEWADGTWIEGVCAYIKNNLNDEKYWDYEFFNFKVDDFVKDLKAKFS